MDFIEKPPEFGLSEKLVFLKKFIKHRSNQVGISINVEVGYFIFESVLKVLSAIKVVELEEQIEDVVILDDLVSLGVFFEVLKIGDFWGFGELSLDSVVVVISVVTADIVLFEMDDEEKGSGSGIPFDSQSFMDKGLIFDHKLLDFSIPAFELVFWSGNFSSFKNVLLVFSLPLPYLFILFPQFL